MTQASPVPDNPHRSAGPAVVLRHWWFTSAQLVLAAAGFTGYLTSSPRGSFLAILLFGIGAGSLIGAAAGATYRAEVRGGQLTFRGQWRRSQSVDLTRLVVVRAPDRLERWQAGRPLILRDLDGDEVRISFYGTSPRGRRELLAALEPFLLSASVSRTGPVDEALAGRLWWPRPRRAVATR
jgi:hypothetical protein